MKTSTKVLLSGIAIIAAGLTFIWPYAKMSVDESANYTEKEVKEYHFYTPDILKNIPRISDNYLFRYSNTPNTDEFIYGVEFSDITDASKINFYLEKSGYKSIGECGAWGECWKGKDPNREITVEVMPDAKIIAVWVADKK